MKNKFIKVLALVITLIMLLSIVPSQVVWALDSMTLKVDTVSTVTGSTVQVKISIENNPGISSIKAKVAFDDILTLTSVEYNTEMGGQSVAPNKLSSPITLLWISAFGDYTNDATFATLTFKTPEGLSENKEANITVTFDPDDIYNVQEENVPMTVVNGKVDILTGIPGDINSDGKVNNKDASRILQYLAGWEVEVDEYAVYTNGDDKANNKDATRLLQFLAGWPVKLYYGPFTAHQHTMEAIPAKAATCTQPGNNAYWHCTECDKYFSTENGSVETTPEAMAVKALGHTVVIDPAVPATETSTGLTEGSHCLVCEEVLVPQIVIPKLTPSTASITYKMVNNDSYLASQEINNPNPSTYTLGKGLTLSNDIEVPGYTFLGWYDSFASNATQIKSIPASATEDITLYAHWERYEYTIQYESELIPVNNDVYTVNLSKTLPTPKLSGYTFVGWSDDEGNIIKRIPAGTVGDKIYSANWLSDRNKSITYNSVDSPLIMEEDNKILFTYEIGEIQNVPVSVIENFGKIVEGGVATERTVEHSKTISNTEVKNYERTVANATTENYGITLSNGWTDSMSVSEEFCKQHGISQEEARQYAVNESSNWYVSSGSSGSKTTSVYSSDEKTSLNTSTSHSDQLVDKVNEATKDSSTVDHKYQNYGFEEEIHAGGKIMGIVDVGGSVSANQGWGSNSTDTNNSFSKDFLNTKTFTSQDSYGENGSRSVTGSNSTSTASWNSESGKGGSKSVTDTKSTATTITEALSEKTGYGKTYINTGSEQTTQGLSSTASNSDRYSNGSTFSVVEQETITEKISTKDTREGYHRVVWATTMHVFLVVGYDIATSSYFTSTISIQDDELQRFEDYSYDSPNYDDNQTSLITFEIPTDIKSYVKDRMSGSEGLQFARDGKVTGYTGTDDYVIIPEYKVINGTVIKVTGIDENAFKGKVTVANGNALKAIEFSEYITEISDSAFEGCSNLEFIDFKNVEKIGSSAFAGCTSLKAIKLSDNITSLGQNAFEGIDAVMAYASNKDVAEAVAKSGAKAIALVISEKCNDLHDVTFEIPSGTEYFGFYGSSEAPREFNNVNIVSDADETLIQNVKFKSTKQTPFKTSSPNVTWAESSISAPNFGMIFTAEQTNLSVYGESIINSARGNAILTRNITLDQINDELYSQLQLNGNVLACGNVERNGLVSFTSGKVVVISEAEYQKHLGGVFTITFNANEGKVSEISREAYFGVETEEFPTPTRDYYTFDGWYLENGVTPITPETLLNNSDDITLYAHWTLNPLSGWTKSSEVPADAQEVNTKWTYTLTEYTSSSSSSMSGWTKYDTKRTSWGPTKGPVYSNPSNGSRNVWSEQYVSGYNKKGVNIYYRYYPSANRIYSAKSGGWLTASDGNRYNYDSYEEFRSDQWNIEPYGSYYRVTGYNGGWVYVYYSRYIEEDNYNSPIYSTRWYYQEPVYTYYFKRDVSKEAASDPTGQSNVSNVVKMVQFRAK